MGDDQTSDLGEINEEDFTLRWRTMRLSACMSCRNQTMAPVRLESHRAEMTRDICVCRCRAVIGMAEMGKHKSFTKFLSRA